MAAEIAAAVIAVIVVILMLVFVAKTVRIVPQARARNIERFGRYRKTQRQARCGQRSPSTETMAHVTPHGFHFTARFFARSVPRPYA